MTARSHLTWLVALSLTAPPVFGSPASDALRAGKEALTLRRYEEAAAIFARGLEATSDAEERWQMLLGLALAGDLGGDPTSAAHYYQAFLADSASHPAASTGRWAERRRNAESDLGELEGRVLETRARVDFLSQPPGAAVHVEGTPRSGSKAPIRYLAAGQHTVELTLEGHLPLLVVVSVEAGQRVTIERALVPLPSEATVAKESPSSVDPAPREVGASSDVPISTLPVDAPVAPPPMALDPLGWSFVGVGTAALAVGSGLSAAAVSTGGELTALREEPVDEALLARDAALRTRLAKFQSGAAAAYAGGGALVVGGMLVLILESSRGESSAREESSARIEPLAGPGFIGAHGSF